MVSLPYVPEIPEAATRESLSSRRRSAARMAAVLFAVAFVTGLVTVLQVGNHVMTGLQEGLRLLLSTVR